jgi:hypothetical protein
MNPFNEIVVQGKVSAETRAKTSTRTDTGGAKSKS